MRGNLLSFIFYLPFVRSIPACAGEPHALGIIASLYAVYPRVCGGTQLQLRPAKVGRGLSPRVRGNQLHLTNASKHTRSIPACAGEPRFLVIVTSGLLGLSPRVRGNPFRKAFAALKMRSIPACAGEPMAAKLRTERTERTEVYPRVCGGTPTAFTSGLLIYGLSPRVRGNPACDNELMPGERSIPACAGEPRREPERDPPIKGLSPRVRGNHVIVEDRPLMKGSIPACAGEPC